MTSENGQWPWLFAQLCLYVHQPLTLTTPAAVFGFEAVDKFAS